MVEQDRKPISTENKKEQLRWLRKLAEDPAYLFLNSLIQQQLDNLYKVCFTPLKSLDSAGEQEYNKGSIEGRCAWENVRQAYIADLEDDIRYEEEHKENASTNSEENTTNADGSPIDGGDSGEDSPHAP